jgi:hypothetical protein
MNNHVMLHSRTAFDDYDDEERRRCLYRVWSGHEHDDRCLAFEARQAQRFQMSVAPSTRL